MPTDATKTDLRFDVIEVANFIVVVTAPNASLRMALGLSPMVVGGGAECDVTIASDPLVSRRHLEIARDPHGRVRVRDLESKNGTFVDRVGVRHAFVEAHNVITLGSTRIVIERASGSSQVALASGIHFGEALGASTPMRALFASLERAAQTEETIVLLGESGTGKELLARGIHEASARRGGPFVVFDCGAVTTTLAESELFGHVKGAFTGAVSAHAGVFEQANGGTLFIDELGELPTELQPKLLRAIEARQVRRLGSSEWLPVDVRIVAATHRDLRARITEGAFREDLYYRLAVLEARVPPLRERPEDIPLLVEHFLSAQRPPRSWSDLPPNAAELMRTYDWPGNIRELRNTVARLILFPAAATTQLSARSVRPSGMAPASQAPLLLGLSLREARDLVLEQFDRAYLPAKLGEHGGNVSRAAESMGVSRQFLHRLLERYRIERD